MDRKAQILQTLAQMLEHPRAERITTAALAAQVQVSEAALYRHFASKAHMFEALIGFVDTTLSELMQQIGTADPDSGRAQVRAAVTSLLAFSERNRGLTRLLTGDALVGEDPRLQDQMNDFVDRLEASIRSMLRAALISAELPSTDDLSARASLIMDFVLGRWQRYATSGWRHSPTGHLEQQLHVLLA